MATQTDNAGAPEGYAEVKKIEGEQLDQFPTNPWPASDAKKQLESLEDRVAFLEARAGLVKPIREHEYDASEQVAPPAPTMARRLYNATGDVEGMQAQTSADTSDATKDELLKQAQDLGVEGRSSMNKDELAAAIAEKQGTSA